MPAYFRASFSPDGLVESAGRLPDELEGSGSKEELVVSESLPRLEEGGGAGGRGRSPAETSSYKTSLAISMKGFEISIGSDRQVMVEN